MNEEATKYSRFEYERRFLVSTGAQWTDLIEPYSKNLEDKYLRKSRFRLRTLTDSDSNRRLIKLTKKYESDSPYFQLISSIILSPEEYRMFDALAGNRLRKKRRYHNYSGRMFSIDVFEDELDGLVLCETEAASLEELMAAEFPGYAKHEVTEDNFFNGGNLCRTTQAELKRKLSFYNFN
jgi:CYTH domain-containing protein